MKKRIYIVVEGYTEKAFIDEMLRPYLASLEIYDARAILIRTSEHGRGGFVKFKHLENTIRPLLKGDVIVSTLIDFFRLPDSMPSYTPSMALADKLEQVTALERALAKYIGDHRFFPYIQLHEFEALLFSSNKGFEYCYDEEVAKKTRQIIAQYPNPEDINSSPEGSPSKRILAIKPDYDKVLEGNLIAQEIGLAAILSRCPRFASWVEQLTREA